MDIFHELRAIVAEIAPYINELRAIVLGMCDPAAVRHLDGNLPAQFLVHAQVNPSETALAQDSRDAGAADPLRDG
jgi:hypothetical protein